MSLRAKIYHINKAPNSSL